MTRDEIRGIIEGISDEQLKKILDINSSDIGKAKNKSDELKSQLEAATAKVAEMEDKISALKESQREADEIKLKAKELQKIVDERLESDKEEHLKQELCRRFEAVAEGTPFVNDFTREGIFEQFKAAVADERNVGKADGEIYAALTTGKDNLFVPDGGVPAVVASTMGFGGALSDGDIREIMGLSNGD